MAKRKLNYRFHNPNPVEVTADYILKVMIEANTEKVEKILQENMLQIHFFLTVVKFVRSKVLKELLVESTEITVSVKESRKMTRLKS